MNTENTKNDNLSNSKQTPPQKPSKSKLGSNKSLDRTTGSKKMSIGPHIDIRGDINQLKGFMSRNKPDYDKKLTEIYEGSFKDNRISQQNDGSGFNGSKIKNLKDQIDKTVHEYSDWSDGQSKKQKLISDSFDSEVNPTASSKLGGDALDGVEEKIYLKNKSINSGLEQNPELDKQEAKNLSSDAPVVKEFKINVINTIESEQSLEKAISPVNELDPMFPTGSQNQAESHHSSDEDSVVNEINTGLIQNEQQKKDNMKIFSKDEFDEVEADLEHVIKAEMENTPSEYSRKVLQIKRDKLKSLQLDMLDQEPEGDQDKTGNGQTDIGSPFKTKRMEERKKSHMEGFQKQKTFLKNINVFKLKNNIAPRIGGKLHKLMESHVYGLFISVCIFYALFVDDIRIILFPPSADLYIDILTCLVMVLFGVEILASCFVYTGYFLSFYFWLDLLSTVTMVFDIGEFGDQSSLMNLTFQKENLKLQKSGIGSFFDVTQMFKASRAARLGSK